MFFLDAELDNDASRDQKKSATLFPEIAGGLHLLPKKKAEFFLQMSRKKLKNFKYP